MFWLVGMERIRLFPYHFLLVMRVRRMSLIECRKEQSFGLFTIFNILILEKIMLCLKKLSILFYLKKKIMRNEKSKAS